MKRSQGALSKKLLSLSVLAIYAKDTRFYFRTVFKDLAKINLLFIKEKISIFQAIVRLANNPGYYYARQIYKSLKGLGVDEEDVFRYIISTSETILENVKTEFLEMKDYQLSAAIDKNFRGDCKDCLLAIVK